MVLDETLVARWRGRHSIMEVVAVPVVSVLVALAGLVQHRDVIWFIDNVATLSAFIKGGCDAPDLDRAAVVVSLAIARSGARVWFEHIESKSNWADDFSRLRGEDTWCPVNGFALRQLEVPSWPWIVPTSGLVPRLLLEVGAALEFVGGLCRVRRSDVGVELA